MLMATKLDRVTYHKGLLLIMSHNPLITCSYIITQQNHYTITTIMSMAIKLGKMVTGHRKRLVSLKPHGCKITWSREITCQIKSIFTTKMPMTTKRGRLVTYHKELPLMKLHDRLVTHVTLPECLWPSVVKMVT